MNTLIIPPELDGLWGKRLIEAAAAAQLPPDVLEALLWRFEEIYLVEAGRRLPGLTPQMLARHLGRLDGYNLVEAGRDWPGLTADDLRPHLMRMSADNLRHALEEWPPHILAALREEIEAYAAIQELVGDTHQQDSNFLSPQQLLWAAENWPGPNLDQ